MKTQISFHNLEQVTHASLDEQIRSLAGRHLSQYLQRFDPDAVELRVNLDKTGDRDFYSASIQLAIPGATLPAREEGFELGPLLNLAFDHLERELSRRVSRLRSD